VTPQGATARSFPSQMNQKAIPFEVLYLNDEGYHLKLKAKVNDLELCLILDTGASQSAFDLHFVQKNFGEQVLVPTMQISAGLGTNSMESFSLELDVFQLGELKIQPFKVAVLDLSNVNHSYERIGLEPIHWVLGNDVLYKFNALIDYRNLQLWLHEARQN